MWTSNLCGQTKYFGSHCTSLCTQRSACTASLCINVPEKLQLWNLTHMQVVYSLLSWQLLYVLPSYVRATSSEADRSLTTPWLMWTWAKHKQYNHKTSSPSLLQETHLRTRCVLQLLQNVHLQAGVDTSGHFTGMVTDSLQVLSVTLIFLPYFGHTGETEGLNKADAGKCFALEWQAKGWL